MSTKNTNIFAGDRSYTTNFFLQFKSAQVERKFRHDAFTRTRYSLQGFLVFSLLALSIQFMTTDCFRYYHSCNHPSLVVSAMVSLILSLAGISITTNKLLLQTLFTVFQVYFHILFLEDNSYHVGLILMTVYTSIAGFLIQQVWFLQLLHNLLSYALLAAYLYISSGQELMKKSGLEFGLDLVMYNLLAAICLAFLEKGRKERWVLVETFKKSDNIFKHLYEELPYAFYVVDKNKRILYSSIQGLNLLSYYSKNCRSCNFSRMKVNLQDIMEPEHTTKVDDILAAATPLNPLEEPVACFVNLKPPTEEYDPNISRFTLGNGNLYKVKAIKTIWKTHYAYMVVLKDYSSKKKSEEITSKTINYLTRQIDEVIKHYDGHDTDKQVLKLKSKMLSKIMKVKFAVFNTMLIFHRIFTKNEGLKDKKTFNIRNSILSTIGILSFKSKEKKIDLQLKFEHSSFPAEVYADEHLFRQTFANALHLLLEELSNTTIVIDCKLASVRDGQYILLFEFKFPQNENLTYESFSLGLDPSSPVTLNHVLSKDTVPFFLALIRPAVEVFNGKIYAEDNDNQVNLCLELIFEASGDSKGKTYLESSTLKTLNYNATANPNPHNYFWKCEEHPEDSHENPEDSHKIEPSKQPQKNMITSNQNLKGILTYSPKCGQKPFDEIRCKLPVKSINNDQARNRMEEKKCMDELQRLSSDKEKFFGSLSEISIIPTINPPLMKKLDSTIHEELRTEADLQEEEKENDDMKKANENIMKYERMQSNLTDYRMVSLGSSTSIPEIETNDKYIPSLRTNHSTLKLAVAKALVEIIEDKKNQRLVDISSLDGLSDGRLKSQRSTIGTAPTLDNEKTIGDPIEGVDVAGLDVYERALKHLAVRLSKEKECEEFMVFAENYVRDLEDELVKTQPYDEFEQSQVDKRDSLYYSAPSEISGKKKLSLSAKKSSFKIFVKRQSGDFVLNNDCERSKERHLNERFLLSPSINKSMRLRSATSLVAKSTEERFLRYLQSPTLTANKTLQKPPSAEQSRLNTPKGPQKALQNTLLPFENTEELPSFLLARSVAHCRRWCGSPNEIASTPEKMFVYNDVFTILAVDDSEFVFKALENLAVKYKRKFEFAKNGTEALKKYYANINQGILYHLVLLDLQMPIMDGFETARVIRAEEASKNYPTTYICAMSAFEDQETINKTRKDGMDNFCQKPLRPEVLNNLIKTRCEQIGIKLND